MNFYVIVSHPLTTPGDFLVSLMQARPAAPRIYSVVCSTKHQALAAALHMLCFSHVQAATPAPPHVSHARMVAPRRCDGCGCVEIRLVDARGNRVNTTRKY
eukprot:3741631-Pleurochrysis_carterae.AAC.1